MRVESTFVLWTHFCGYFYAVFYCYTCKYFGIKYNGYVFILGRVIKYADTTVLLFVWGTQH